MNSEAPLRNVVVFGAGGTNIGHHIVKALATKPESFNVSIIARKSTKSTFPEGVEVQYIDDALRHDDLVSAMRRAGADVLVSAVGSGGDIVAVEEKLIDAAIEANIRRFLPSEYGLNNTHPAARALCPIFDAKGRVVEILKEKEHTGLTWTAVPTGLWLDWTLDPNICFADINIKAHTAALWGAGEHTLSWSTLPWAAEGIARILLTDPSKTANKVVPIRAFEASQTDVLAALEKIEGKKYEITKHFDAGDVIGKAKASWRENKDTPSALWLVKAGLFTGGYGSDLVHEAIVQVGNEYLDLTELRMEDVVEKAVKAWA
ncbi:hypothetical protein LTR99_007741 [Exophiala xenobiotica]|uniref:NmrA-like domain-containing protein n=1 Tax=Vermiconidia calcicola TaxID=1690605 RepID=A0AAV9Q3Z6_9PEZI|nr:hypothetical protein LTR41_005033 [Exophiala xenobiotica]KAK5535288.1 hypothetical protein LTR25_006296 [Vermiconidia calcicola]KAK5546789.1 hypothetical protein LTR23_003160 [Chaetothyriales sp. CCFEE 6169]KAK5243128.1 hypothetical protein LTS06_011032 [Exophiala xenobiotica]KAK5273688.1 hypothetical protein LTR96_000288 [Exophiala xenobiotica]